MLLNLATNAQLALELWQGNRDALAFTQPLDTAVRFAREFTIALAAILLINGIASHRRGRRRRNPIAPWVIAMTLWLVGLVSWGFWKGLPTTVVIGGLRFVPLLAIGATLPGYSRQSVQNLGRILGVAATALVFIEFVVVGMQLSTAPGVFGSNFVGPRAWGSLPSPDSLGLAMVGCILLVVAFQARWRLATVVAATAISVSTGSRAAILSAGALILAVAINKFRGRWLAVTGLIAAAVPAYLLVTLPQVSGRQISGEGRLEVWSSNLSRLSPVDLVFGQGLGVGGNSVATLLGRGATGQIISDSTIVSVVLSLGVVGLAAFALMTARAYTAMPFHLGLYVAAAALIPFLAFNLPELAPLNIACVVVYGCGASSTRREQAMPPPGLELRR